MVCSLFMDAQCNSVVVFLCENVPSALEYNYGVWGALRAPSGGAHLGELIALPRPHSWM